MTWWQKIFGQSQKTPTHSSQFPLDYELIPGKLTARVYLHEIETKEGRVPCWSYITNGLRTHQQKELIFTLRRHPNEEPSDFPLQPLQYFQTVYEFAMQGRLVDEGSFTQFNPPGFLDGSASNALIYIRPQPLKGVEVPFPSLAAILVTPEEYEVYQHFGHTRVMAHLGRAYTYYPCPPWSERSRASVVSMQALQDSLVARMYSLKISGARVCQQTHQPSVQRLPQSGQYLQQQILQWSSNQAQITLRLLPQASEDLYTQLMQCPTNTVVALLTELDPTADGCLVWQSGQNLPFAITPPNSKGMRLSGSFVAFVPQQSEDGGQIHEDGFAMMLTDTSWEIIKQAIALKQPISVPATNNKLNFSLEWIPQTYQNPIDGLSYEAEGGWNRYSPIIEDDQDGEQPHRIREVILLTSDSELAARVGISALAEYIQGIEEAVKAHFATCATQSGQDLLLEFELHTDSPISIGMALRPWREFDHLEQLRCHLLERPTPKVSQSSIKFQVIFQLWGGAGESP
jgi:hypothetical protein